MVKPLTIKTPKWVAEVEISLSGEDLVDAWLEGHTAWQIERGNVRFFDFGGGLQPEQSLSVLRKFKNEWEYLELLIQNALTTSISSAWDSWEE